MAAIIPLEFKGDLDMVGTRSSLIQGLDRAVRFTTQAGGGAAPRDSVGHTAASAARDLSGFLAAVDGKLDALESDWLSPDGAQVVVSLRSVASYLRGWAVELKGAAIGSGRRETNRPMRLATWWPSVDVLLRALHGGGLIVRADIPRNLPCVGIKRHHLTQVVIELVDTASHSIADRAFATVDARMDVPAATRGEVAIAACVAGHGRAVQLTVADNGAGIGGAKHERAFHPARFGKPGRGGARPGLAMVHRLVMDAGGGVALAHVPGAGTTVTIELPIHAAGSARRG